jgi:hypothetical protein
MLLIQNLNDCGLIREIWPYLVVKDISCLITASKDVRVMSILTNEVVSQNIILDLNKNSEETERFRRGILPKKILKESLSEAI